MTKGAEKAAKEAQGLRGRLGNPRFVASAPEEEVEKARENLAAARGRGGAAPRGAGAAGGDRLRPRRDPASAGPRVDGTSPCRSAAPALSGRLAGFSPAAGGGNLGGHPMKTHDQRRRARRGHGHARAGPGRRRRRTMTCADFMAMDETGHDARRSRTTCTPRRCRRPWTRPGRPAPTPPRPTWRPTTPDAASTAMASTDATADAAASDMAATTGDGRYRLHRHGGDGHRDRCLGRRGTAWTDTADATPRPGRRQRRHGRA